jgi:hypothetical protein
MTGSAVAGGFRDVGGRELDESVAKVDERTAGGELVTDLRHRAVARVPPGVADPLNRAAIRRREYGSDVVSLPLSAIWMSTLHCLVSWSRTSLTPACAALFRLAR